MTLFSFLELLGTIVILATISYWAANMYLRLRISRELMEHETPFQLESEDATKTILVLGDSTGVGVGAERPEHSVAGRLAERVGATWVENYAVSGAEVSDLPEQIKQAKLSHYDYILLQIGGNDIIAFHNPKRIAQLLGTIFGTLPKARQIFLMSAGNVGGATMFPHIARPFYTAMNMRYHSEFARVAHAWCVTYVNLFDPFWKDAFLRDPGRYLSLDGLHPSTYGYGLWFDKLKKEIK